MVIDASFGHWFAGFFDGEGCFNIQKKLYKGPYGSHPRCTYACTASIRLRDDDAPILERIAQVTGLGRGETSRNYQSDRLGAKPQAKWVVVAKADCVALVAIFDAYPLQSKKARDFAIWRQAVIRWAGMTPQHVKGRIGPLPYDWTDIANLRDALLLGRRYAALELVA